MDDPSHLKVLRRFLLGLVLGFACTFGGLLACIAIAYAVAWFVVETGMIR